jgi:hypothetical protein
MKGNVKRNAILIISAILLALIATFFYINNDLNVSLNKEKFAEKTTVPEQTEVVTEAREDSDLDTIFDEEDPTDNFDDIIM